MYKFIEVFSYQDYASEVVIYKPFYINLDMISYFEEGLPYKDDKKVISVDNGNITKSDFKPYGYIYSKGLDECYLLDQKGYITLLNNLVIGGY